MTYKDATVQDIDVAMRQAATAFIDYKKVSLQQRRDWLHAIAAKLEEHSAELVSLAMAETHLKKERLEGELVRTCFQLRSYSDAALAGHWLDARIDTALPDRKPAPRPDIRKLMVPIGPVVVFGASNFPFAYSTAGGDTAGALAAGCPVVVKGHPAHAQTSERVADLILESAAEHGLPEGVFVHVHGAGFEVGEALVKHEVTKAVAFTGSYSGGRALYDWAAQRKEPIPVFSEMGSINPVFLLPGKLKASAAEVAKMYASSITISVGQFCTNPGLLIGIDSPELDGFIHQLGNLITAIAPDTMLHPGIAKAFTEKRRAALSQKGVTTEATSKEAAGLNQGTPTLASVSGRVFLENPLLHQEVFGPYSLIVKCADEVEMVEVARHLEGQLVGTVMATDEDYLAHGDLMDAIRSLCGRFILNNVPTGVEVCFSMQHGGPFPATTDSRFTSVGSDGIKRFARPIAWQNFPDHLLPDALRNSNPLGIWRLVNNQWSNGKL